MRWFALIVGRPVVAEQKKTELKLSGMTCATCASTIEKALRNLPGVVAAQVNFGSEVAEVEYESSQVKLHDLEKAVSDAGYQTVNEQVVLKVGGMSCVSCETAVTNAMKALDGVVSVTVNLATETAYVTYNPTLTTIAEMKGAIESAGYRSLRHRGRSRGRRRFRTREGPAVEAFENHHWVCGRHPAHGLDVYS